MPNGTERMLAEVRKHYGVALAEVRKHSGVSRNHPESQVDASPDGLRPIPSKSRYGTVLEVVVFWAAKCPLQEKGGQNSSATRLCSGSVAWPSEAVRGVRMTHAKKQRRKENRAPVCVILGAKHLFSQLPFSSQREEHWPKDRSANSTPLGLMPNGTERMLAVVRKHSGAEARKHSGVSRN